MGFIGYLLTLAIDIYVFIILLEVAVSWLVIFKVFDLANPQARNLVDLLKKATDPVMVPIRKYVPPIGGLDLTPVVAIIGLQVLSYLIMQIFGRVYF
jgi:YggT family protein